MRKTSQDGGDSTSITSGIENEIKKPGAIIKTKRNSIKRKVQNFSHESDDAVVEPLLQKDKEKTDTSKPSAKFNLLSKTKTEATSERGSDKDKLISDDKLQKSALSNASDVTDRILPSSNIKENTMSKYTSANAPLHNHMNTNVFSSHDASKGFVAPKSQILVEIDGSKQVGYNPSPLIFTTAKIHTDGKSNHMEPVQVTPGPILSTIEVSVAKRGSNKGETSGLVSPNISTVYANVPKSNVNTKEQDDTTPFRMVNKTSTPSNKATDTKILISTDKKTVSSNPSDINSLSSPSSHETQLTQSKVTSNIVKDNVVENKCINIEHKKDTGGYQTKTKTITPNESKSAPAAFATTKATSVNNNSKESGTIDQAVAAAKGCDKTSKDKNVANTNTSFNDRQLQRQNIVIDKDHTISKIKSNSNSSTLTNDPKDLKKSGECVRPSVIEASSLSDKSKLPKSGANGIPITSANIMSINTSAADNKTSAPITSVVDANKVSTSITSTVVVSKTSTSFITTAATNQSSVPIISNAPANKIFVAITTTAPFPPITATANINKTADLITTTKANNKASTSITTAAAIKKTSAPIATTVTVTKTSAAIMTTVAVNKSPALITTTTATNKKNTSSTTATANNKTSAPITSTIVVNKISPPTTTTATSKIATPSATSAVGNKTSGPTTMTADTNKMSATFNTAATNNTSVPITTSTAIIHTSTSNSISTGKSNLTSSFSTSPTSSNTAMTKPVVTAKSFAPESLITNNVVTSAKSGSTSSTIKPQVTSKIYTKPSSSKISAPAPKVSAVTTSATTSQPNTIQVKSPIVITTTTKTIPQTTVSKSIENTLKGSTSNAKPSTTKSNSISISSAATSTHGISNITTTGIVSSSTSAFSGSSSKSVVPNKQSDSKSNELSSSSKNFKA